MSEWTLLEEGWYRLTQGRGYALVYEDAYDHEWRWEVNLESGHSVERICDACVETQEKARALAEKYLVALTEDIERTPSGWSLWRHRWWLMIAPPKHTSASIVIDRLGAYVVEIRLFNDVATRTTCYSLEEATKVAEDRASKVALEYEALLRRLNDV